MRAGKAGPKKCPNCGTVLELHIYPDDALCCPNPNCYYEEKCAPDSLQGDVE
jgi:hypothetical protein